MSFFSKLFGWLSVPQPHNTPKNEKTTTKVEVGNPFYTNAPEHWGIITDEFLAPNANFSQSYDNQSSDSILVKRMFMVNSLVLLEAINKNLSQSRGVTIIPDYQNSFIDSSERYGTSCCVYKLFDKGTIMTNGVVIDDYQMYAVMLFTTPTSFAYINQLKEKFVANGFRDMIYYCTTDPATVENPIAIVLPFIALQKESFTSKDDQSRDSRKYQQYALWWASNTQKVFKDSIAFKTLQNYYHNSSDVNTYILGKLDYALGRNKDQNRIMLPDYDEVIFSGPEDVEIIMTISDQSGINFHFPIDPKFEKYRDNFLASFADFTRSIKEQIVENNWDRDTVIVKPKWLDQVGTKEDIQVLSLILSDEQIKYMN